MTRIILSLCLVMCAGCAKTLEELSPFPCPDDHCPSPFECVPGVGCVPARDLPRYEPFPCDRGCPSPLVCVPGKGCTSTPEEFEGFACATAGEEEEDVAPCPGTLVCAGSKGCIVKEHLAAIAPFACGVGNTCPEGFSCVTKLGCTPTEVCDPLAQDCKDAKRPKCSLVQLAGGTRKFLCLASRGAVAPSASCTRIEGEAAETVGQDDCVAGAFCTQYVGDASGRICRRFCGADGGCASDESCVNIFGDAGAIGLCAKSCAIRGQCGAGFSCAPIQPPSGLTDGLVCAAAGKSAFGTECASDATVCGSDTACRGNASGSYFCRSLCRDAADCPSATCTPDAHLGGAGGFCECALGSTCPTGKSCKAVGKVAAVAWRDCFDNGAGLPAATCARAEDCAIGLSCLSNGDWSACLRECDAGHPCGVGTCSAGVCSCAPFQQCSAIETCRPTRPAGAFSVRFYCSGTGTAALDADCAGGCPRDAVCWGTPGDYKCRPMCDKDHPCTNGKNCTKYSGFPNEGGLCY